MTCHDLILSPFADLPAYWWLPLAAAILDRVVGDPPRLPHPVRCIGALLNRAEPAMRKRVHSDFAAGLAAVVFVLAVVWGVTRGLMALPFFLGLTAAAYLSFAGLAHGQLVREGRAALALLEKDDLDAARRAVGFLVSRDVSKADKEELCRVLAESLSENLNDAFVAPLFWLVLTGPVGLWLYKASSTMDSMWGYPYAPWTRFGTVAAKLDDALAYIPARLTVVFMLVAAQLTGLINRRPDFSAMRADARKMKSPNAGWPMAACARIHGATMGGKAVYAGKTVDKPILGPDGAPWTIPALRRLIRHLETSALLAVIGLWSGGLIVHLWLR